MSARNTPRKTVLKMTKGHFQTIAATIATGPTNGLRDAAGWARHFANVLAKTNPRFDRETFIKACIGD